MNIINKEGAPKMVEKSLSGVSAASLGGAIIVLF